MPRLAGWEASTCCEWISKVVANAISKVWVSEAKWTDERIGNGAAPRHDLHPPAAGGQSAAGGGGVVEPFAVAGDDPGHAPGRQIDGRAGVHAPGETAAIRAARRHLPLIGRRQAGS